MDFRFLIGAWVREGKPGDGSGSFSLEPDLGGKILVRRNTAGRPTANGRPAGKHEDLMIIYQEDGGKHFRASYFANEARDRRTVDMDVGKDGNLIAHEGAWLLNAKTTWPTPKTCEVTVDFDSGEAKRGLVLDVGGGEMIELSPDTIRRIHSLFPEREWPIVEEALRNHAVFQNMEAPTWFELAERVRFAVLKLSCGHLEALHHFLNEARIDWRDTLMAAGFGHDTSAHKHWQP